MTDSPSLPISAMQTGIALDLAANAIRAAMAELHDLDRGIRVSRAGRDDADWDQPNAATEAIDHLAEALEALHVAGGRS